MDECQPLALGNVEAREIGPRSRVWSEPEMVQAGAFEFSETEDFLAAAEVRRCRLTL